MTGYDREELVGQSARILYPDDRNSNASAATSTAESRSRGAAPSRPAGRGRTAGSSRIQLSSSPIDSENWAKASRSRHSTSRPGCSPRKPPGEDRGTGPVLLLCARPAVHRRSGWPFPPFEPRVGAARSAIAPRTWWADGSRLRASRRPRHYRAGHDAAGRQQVVLNFVNRYRHRDGSYRWIEWRSFPAGRLVYAAARDITSRKVMEEERIRLQAQLQQASKMEVDRAAGRRRGPRLQQPAHRHHGQRRAGPRSDLPRTTPLRSDAARDPAGRRDSAAGAHAAAAGLLAQADHRAAGDSTSTS